MNKRVRISEIAEAAGVSAATVSKVVNKRSDVSPATRARVTEAIERMGYVSPVDRSATTGLPVIVALLAGLDTAYSATVLQGIINGGQAHGAEIVTRFGLRNPGGFTSRSSPSLPPGCVGIIAVTLGMRDLRLLHPHTSLPVVVVDPSEPRTDDWMTIGATNWIGAKTATEHLITLGHRSIGWIGGPAASEASVERRHGYRAALEGVGLHPRPDWVADADFTVEAGRAAATRMLQGPSAPTAIVAANDEIAIGVIAAARAMGSRVPEDLSVTGFDDTPQATWSTPQLTTIRQPLADMGKVAVSMILDTVSGRAPDSRHLQLATELVVRGSTAPPLARDARRVPGDQDTSTR